MEKWLNLFFLTWMAHRRLILWPYAYKCSMKWNMGDLSSWDDSGRLMLWSFDWLWKVAHRKWLILWPEWNIGDLSFLFWMTLATYALVWKWLWQGTLYCSYQFPQKFDPNWSWKLGRKLGNTLTLTHKFRTKWVNEKSVHLISKPSNSRDRRVQLAGLCGQWFWGCRPRASFCSRQWCRAAQWSGLLQALFFDKVQVTTKGLSMPFFLELFLLRKLPKSQGVVRPLFPGECRCEVLFALASKMLQIFLDVLDVRWKNWFRN